MLSQVQRIHLIIVAVSVASAVPALARSHSSGSTSSTVVVIDAGHGGFDRGGIPGQRVAEKTMTLDVALRLRKVLQARGYRVVMTRDRDVFVPLPTRVAIANSYRNAIFVCIHFNSAKRRGANGIETYFYGRDSLPLASAIHYYVAGGAPTPNRGVRRRGYYVLRRTRIPAVLVECGFLTNPTETRYVLNSSYREKLAEEIARGIGSRSEVVRSSGSSQLAANAVPLQPFIDQTHVHDPDISHSHRHHHRRRHSSKKSSRSSSKSKSHKGKKSESTAESKSGSHSKKTASKKKKSTSKSED
jgi:N-acetylmuramoyl-L-alanine amidase